MDKEKILEAISEMKVTELVDLISAIEEKFGVSADAVAMAIAPSVGGAESSAEKTEFDVIIKSAGAKKIDVIKIVRSVTSLGLKEAKELVDSSPADVKKGISKEEAEKLKKELEGAGAEVEIK